MSSSPSSSYIYSSRSCSSLSVSYPQAPGVQLASVKSEEYATDLSVVNWERESDTLSGTGELGRGAEFVGTPSTELDEEPTNEPLQPQQYPASGALPWPLYNHSSHLWLSTSHLQTPDAQLPRDHSTDFVRQIFLPDQYALNQSSHAGPSTIYNGQVGLHYSGGVQRAPDPPKSLGYRVEAGTSIIPKHIHNPQSSFSTPFAGGFNPPVIHNDFLTSSIGQYNLNRVPQAGPPSIPVGQVSSYVGEVQDTYFHSLNSLGCHVDAGHPAIAIYPHHGQPSHLSHLYSTKAPVTSSSRQTLTDIQPGQEELYSRDAQAAQHYTLDFVILPGPPEPRQRRSKDNRQQPYNKAKKGTRRSKESSLAILHPIPSSIIPSSDVIATAKADFRLLQAMVCPILIGGQACGQSIGSAKEMVAHLSMSHNVYRDKRKTANADLEGRCPLCDVQMDGGSIHRHLTRHFYYYICPVEVCHKKFSRSYEIRAHCKTHGFEMSDNEDFAVRK